MADALYVYDGECLLCSRFVRFLVKHDRKQELRLATAQSAAGRAIYREHELDPDEMSTAIFQVGDRTWINLDLLIEGLAWCGGPWKAARLLHVLPGFLSDWIYRCIARNRKLFNRGQCPMPSPEMKARLLD